MEASQTPRFSSVRNTLSYHYQTFLSIPIPSANHEVLPFRHRHSSLPIHPRRSRCAPTDRLRSLQYGATSRVSRELSKARQSLPLFIISLELRHHRLSTPASNSMATAPSALPMAMPTSEPATRPRAGTRRMGRTHVHPPPSLLLHLDFLLPRMWLIGIDMIYRCGRLLQLHLPRWRIPRLQHHASSFRHDPPGQLLHIEASHPSNFYGRCKVFHGTVCHVRVLGFYKTPSQRGKLDRLCNSGSCCEEGRVHDLERETRSE